MTMRCKLVLIFPAYLFTIFAPLQIMAQTDSQILFFSDITSGPNNGNSDNSFG